MTTANSPFARARVALTMLAAEMRTRELALEDKRVWLDRCTDLMGGGPHDETLFADRLRRGLDEEGAVVHADPAPAATDRMPEPYAALAAGAVHARSGRKWRTP